MEAAEQLHRNMQNKVQELEAREPTSRPEGTQPNVRSGGKVCAGVHAGVLS